MDLACLRMCWHTKQLVSTESPPLCLGGFSLSDSFQAPLEKGVGEESLPGAFLVPGGIGLSHCNLIGPCVGTHVGVFW